MIRYRDGLGTFEDVPLGREDHQAQTLLMPLRSLIALFHLHLSLFSTPSEYFVAGTAIPNTLLTMYRTLYNCVQITGRSVVVKGLCKASVFVPDTQRLPIPLCHTRLLVSLTASKVFSSECDGKSTSRRASHVAFISHDEMRA